MSRGQGIKPLNALFAKYQQLLKAPQGSVIKAFCEVVEEELGFSVGTEQVSYTPATRCLYVRTRGPLKSELLQHKNSILNHLRGRLGEGSAPKDIL